MFSPREEHECLLTASLIAHIALLQLSFSAVIRGSKVAEDIYLDEAGERFAGAAEATLSECVCIC